jgi:NitT/TauT family transport system permease protein
MASAVAVSGRPASPPRTGSGRGRGIVRAIVRALVILAVVAVVWEGVKFLGGVPWRAPGAEPGAPVLHQPPFRWPFANDLNLPHIWTIALALAEPFQRGANVSLAQYLFGAALYTWREAALGFLVGTALGMVLSTLFVHVRLLERALVPYVVASQTIPIIALAPIIVIWTGNIQGFDSATRRIIAVVIVATYLTFFPVTIAMIRGLRSFDPRAMELMRSYAATRWQIYTQLRLPASLPYLFTALKIAATASVVGAIIGEDTGAIQAGLGRVITTFAQYYITGPEKLWAAILAAALLGIAFFFVLRLMEFLTLRGRSAATA